MKSEQQSVLAPRHVTVFNIGAYWEMNNSFLKKSFKIPKPKGVIRIRKSKDGQHNGKTGQKDKQWSTKHTHKTKDRVTQAPLKTGTEFGCSRKVSCSCSTSGTHRVNLITNPVIVHEWRKDRCHMVYWTPMVFWSPLFLINR